MLRPPCTHSPKKSWCGLCCACCELWHTTCRFGCDHECLPSESSWQVARLALSIARAVYALTHAVQAFAAMGEQEQEEKENAKAE